MSISYDEAVALGAAYTAAWNSKDPRQVASFFAEKSQIVINRGTPWIDRPGVTEMAAGFHRDVPDLDLVCDGVRPTGDHMVYLWTFTGHDASTGHPLKIHGMEEWDIDDTHKVIASRGWFDAEDYSRQANGA